LAHTFLTTIALNIATATTLALRGPGRYSLDRLLGIRVPGWFVVLTALGALGILALGAVSQAEPAESAEAG
jgi:putative oxidoreductase